MLHSHVLFIYNLLPIRSVTLNTYIEQRDGKNQLNDELMIWNETIVIYFKAEFQQSLRVPERATPLVKLASHDHNPWCYATNSHHRLLVWTVEQMWMQCLHKHRRENGKGASHHHPSPLSSPCNCHKLLLARKRASFGSPNQLQST